MADEKPKTDFKPKVDFKPKSVEKPAEKPAEVKHAGVEITKLIFLSFIFMSLLGGVLASATTFISGLGSKSFSVDSLIVSYTRPFASVLNPIGGFSIISSEDADVYDSPGGNKIGTQKKQATGRVVKGSTTVDGETYWYIDFDDGVDGWVREKDMRYIDPITRELGQKESVGTVVKTKDSTVSVYNEAGGEQIGVQAGGNSYGKIIKGPQQKNGIDYWYVDFDNGVDGWVKGTDLLAVEPTPPPVFTKLMLLVNSISSWTKVVLWFIIPILIFVIIYVIYNLTQVRKNIRLKLYQTLDESVVTPVSINRSWDRVKLYIESYNESEWRLAVIEADIMLAELLDTMNLGGDSIGDKLKGVEKSDFTTLDLAWEAHKIRNQIAHDPSFMLTQREAKRVIGLYEAVFKEFAFV
ncbi:MAG: hypothetical protein ACYCZW_01360 [Minisyncoccota bacterium]